MLGQWGVSCLVEGDVYVVEVDGGIGGNRGILGGWLG